MRVDDPLQHARLLVRTAAHLRPHQIAHRVRLRALKVAMARSPEWFEQRWRRAPGSWQWPQDFRPLDQPLWEPAVANDSATGKFDFIGQRIDLGTPIDWQAPMAPQLWRYNLHYWEWAFALANHDDRTWAREQFATMWRSWRSGTRFGRWDEWSPYVVAVRSWSLCSLFPALGAGTEVERELLRDLALHSGFVANNLELDVGGNHLIKNLKALVALGVILRDDRRVDSARRHLADQLQLQVLDDGGHFELSPSYHAQVLGDLIDIDRLITASSSTPIPGLWSAIGRMREWLARMLMPDGDVPAFNDSTWVGAERLNALGVAPTAPVRLRVLGESGYVVMRPNERIHLIADVGRPCPPMLPAHAQADCLNFELAVYGNRIVVDPGTSTYDPGARRAWERSTSAHNTVAIDGQDQTEVWATFRAARLARPTLEHAADADDVVEVTASHDGYTRLEGRPVHRRSWRVDDRRVQIEDEVLGTGTHTMSARLQFAPGLEPRLSGSSVDVAGVRIDFDTPESAQLQVIPPVPGLGGVATAFGEPMPAFALELSLAAELPTRWLITFEPK